MHWTVFCSDDTTVFKFPGNIQMSEGKRSESEVRKTKKKPWSLPGQMQASPSKSRETPQMKWRKTGSIARYLKSPFCTPGDVSAPWYLDYEGSYSSQTCSEYKDLKIYCFKVLKKLHGFAKEWKALYSIDAGWKYHFVSLLIQSYIWKSH